MPDNWDANLPEATPDFSFDSEGVDPAKVGSSITIDQPGKYHFEITKVREDFDTQDDKGNLKCPQVHICCVVLHSVAGQSPAGTMYYQTLRLGGKGGGAPDKSMMEIAVAFLSGIGLLQEQDGKFIDPSTKSTRIDVMSLKTRLVSWQFIGWIKHVKSRDPQYPDKIELPFGRGAFPIDDEQVRNVPKCLDALKLIGKEHCMPPVVAGKTPPAKPAKAKDAKPDNPAPAHTPSAPPTTVASTTPTGGGSAFPPVATAAAGDDLDDL